MKAVKLRIQKSKNPILFQDTPSYFRVIIEFVDSLQYYVGEDTHVIVHIISEVCKCWTYVYHNMFDYLFQELKSFSDLKIEQHNGVASFEFMVDYTIGYNKDMQYKIEQDLKKIFEYNNACKETLFLQFKHYYKQQQKMLGITNGSI